MKDQIDSLFKKEMTRKEFLQYIGSGLLVLFGITSLLKAFTQPSHSQSSGYGSSAYGGRNKLSR